MKTLQEALEIGESIDIEFKSWIKAHNMKERISLAVDELIAFANCKGGTVYLGVEDNCDVTGCTGKYDLQAISESIYDKTRPPMFTEIEEIEYEDNSVRRTETIYTSVQTGYKTKTRKGENADVCTMLAYIPPGKEYILGRIHEQTVRTTTEDGKNVTKLPEHKRAAYLGRVFQDPMTGTTATMQIDENLALAARRGQRRGLGWGISKKEKTQFHDLLKTLDLGLEDRMTSKVGLLSGGQRQAVTLLMASLKKPKVLLLDEHTAALDPKTAAKVLALTDKIIEENHLTAMMVTHNMRDAIAHGNRLIMMNNGRVILNISGEEKKRLTVEDLLVKFEEVSGEEFDSDKALLG